MRDAIPIRSDGNRSMSGRRPAAKHPRPAVVRSEVAGVRSPSGRQVSVSGRCPAQGRRYPASVRPKPPVSGRLPGCPARRAGWGVATGQPAGSTARGNGARPPARTTVAP